MSDNSRIEWTDATWNPVTGCTKVSPACQNCYAERLAGRRMHAEWRERIEDPQYAGGTRLRAFGDVRCHEDRLDVPLHWRKPRRIFLCSMGDLFHPAVPNEFLFRVFDVFRQCLVDQRGHTFQILTKRPERMRDFCLRLRFDGKGAGRLYLDEPGRVTGYRLMPQRGCGGLPNVWLGVTAENQMQANHRIPELLQTPAAMRFVSCEPLLGPLGIEPWLTCPDCGRNGTDHGKHRSECKGRGNLDWVITGPETGPRKRPTDEAWLRSLRDQCAASAVPFFLKKGTLDGQEWKQFPVGISPEKGTR
jgi:protein gp37